MRGTKGRVVGVEWPGSLGVLESTFVLDEAYGVCSFGGKSSVDCGSLLLRSGREGFPRDLFVDFTVGRGRFLQAQLLKPSARS